MEAEKILRSRKEGRDRIAKAEAMWLERAKQQDKRP